MLRDSVVAGATGRRGVINRFVLRGESFVPRVCFLMQIRPESVPEYTRRHAAVWPELLDALTESGLRNYSLHISDAGLIVGYAEADDPERAQTAFAATAPACRWQQYMAPLFDTGDGTAAIHGPSLHEVFHLPGQTDETC